MGEREEIARDGMAGDVEDVFSDDALGLAGTTGESGGDAGAGGGSGADGENAGTEAGRGSAGS